MSASARSSHPGMTLKVYRISPASGERKTINAVTVGASKTPAVTSRWPTCSCPRCTPRGATS